MALLGICYIFFILAEVPSAMAFIQWFDTRKDGELEERHQLFIA